MALRVTRVELKLTVTPSRTLPSAPTPAAMSHQFIVRTSSPLSLPSLEVRLDQLFDTATVASFGPAPIGVWWSEKELRVNLSSDATIVQRAFEAAVNSTGSGGDSGSGAVKSSSLFAPLAATTTATSSLPFSILSSGWRLRGFPSILATISPEVVDSGVNIVVVPLPSPSPSVSSSTGASSTGASSTGGPRFPIFSSTGGCAVNDFACLARGDDTESGSSFLATQSGQIGLGVGIGGAILLIGTIFLCIAWGRRRGRLHREKLLAQKRLLLPPPSTGGTATEEEVDNPLDPTRRTPTAADVLADALGQGKASSSGSGKKTKKSAKDEIVLHMITEEEEGDEFSRTRTSRSSMTRSSHLSRSNYSLRATPTPFQSPTSSAIEMAPMSPMSPMSPVSPSPMRYSHRAEKNHGDAIDEGEEDDIGDLILSPPTPPLSADAAAAGHGDTAAKHVPAAASESHEEGSSDGHYKIVQHLDSFPSPLELALEAPIPSANATTDSGDNPDVHPLTDLELDSIDLDLGEQPGAKSKESNHLTTSHDQPSVIESSSSSSSSVASVAAPVSSIPSQSSAVAPSDQILPSSIFPMINQTPMTVIATAVTVPELVTEADEEKAAATTTSESQVVDISVGDEAAPTHAPVVGTESVATHVAVDEKEDENDRADVDAAATAEEDEDEDEDSSDADLASPLLAEVIPASSSSYSPRLNVDTDAKNGEDAEIEPILASATNVVRESPHESPQQSPLASPSAAGIPSPSAAATPAADSSLPCTPLSSPSLRPSFDYGSLVSLTGVHMKARRTSSTATSGSATPTTPRPGLARSSTTLQSYDSPSMSPRDAVTPTTPRPTLSRATSASSNGKGKRKPPVRIHQAGASPSIGPTSLARKASVSASPRITGASSSGTPLMTPLFSPASPTLSSSSPFASKSHLAPGAAGLSGSVASSAAASNGVGRVGKYLTLMVMVLTILASSPSSHVVIAAAAAGAKRTININFDNLYPIDEASGVTAPLTSFPVRATNSSSAAASVNTTSDVTINLNYVHVLSGLDPLSNARFGVFCDAEPPRCQDVIPSTSTTPSPSFTASLVDSATTPYTTLQGACRQNYAYADQQILQCARPGGAIEVRWTLLNTGSHTWKPDEVWMVTPTPHPYASSGWPRSKLVLEEEIEPMRNGTFIGLVRLPLTTGIFNLTWSVMSSCTGAFGSYTAPIELTCSNGIFCDGMERLVNGVCQPATRAACDDEQRCTVDTCDETRGTCKYTMNSVDTQCAFTAQCTTPPPQPDGCTKLCSLNRVCGDDGCNGICSTCPTNFGCGPNFQCTFLQNQGLSCTRPNALVLPSATLVGTHTHFIDLTRGVLQVKFACAPDATGGQMIYTFTVPNDGTIYGADFRFGNGTVDTIMELRRGYCTDPLNNQVINLPIVTGPNANTWCNDDATPPGRGGSALTVTLAPGTYYLYLGAVNAQNALPATLTARITAGYTPQCEGRFCGSDGGPNGTVCGVCPTGTQCDALRRCTPVFTAPECSTQRCMNQTAVCGFDACNQPCGSMNGQCPSGETCILSTGQCQRIEVCNNFAPVCVNGCNSTSYCASDCKCHGVSENLPDLIINTDRLRQSLLIDTRRFDNYSCALNEACIGGLGERRLLKFDTTFINQGRSKLTLPKPSTRPAEFPYDACHGHYHYTGFAEFQLLSNRTLTNGALASIRRGRKHGSCMVSSNRFSTSLIGPDIMCRGTINNCDNPGLDRGWMYTFASSLDCQWIDITGVPAGNYTLRIEINAQRRILEESYDNNVETITVTIP